MRTPHRQVCIGTPEGWLIAARRIQLNKAQFDPAQGRHKRFIVVARMGSHCAC